VAGRLRRDFTAILNLIKAHAVLHQASAAEDRRGRIIARIADYRAVRKLVNDLVSEGVERTVSPTVRETVNMVEQICSEIDIVPTARALRLRRLRVSWISTVHQRHDACSSALGWATSRKSKP
jgi:hypothetical protein